MKKIIGIDIGFSNTGVVVATIPELRIERAFTIVSKSDPVKQSMRVADQRIQRIQYITQEIADVIIAEQIIKGNKILCAVEAPHGGAQSSTAMRDMAAALSIVVTLLSVMNVPTDYLSPSEVKLIATGKRSGDKDQIIKGVCKKFGIASTEKRIEIKKGKRKGKVSNRRTFHIGNNIEAMPITTFEHVSDALAAIWWCSENSNLFKIFAQTI